MVQARCIPTVYIHIYTSGTPPAGLGLRLQRPETSLIDVQRYIACSDTISPNCGAPHSLSARQASDDDFATVEVPL